MRSELDAEMHGSSRRDGVIRRFGIPIVAAAAVVAAAIGGYAVLGGNDGRNGFAPAATTSKSPKPTPTSTSTPKPTPPPPKPTPTQSSKPKEQETKPQGNPNLSYKRCIELVRSAGAWDGGSIKGLSGKLAVDNGKGTTVVVANRTDAYTCNIKPDSAVSRPRPLGTPATTAAFTFAFGATRNVLPNDPGEMVWAGGALPEGVSTITYAFPDGHQERAAIKNGFWVMQYFSEDPFVGEGEPLGDPIEVILDGSGGQRELTMDWTVENMCNQVSHGC